MFISSKGVLLIADGLYVLVWFLYEALVRFGSAPIPVLFGCTGWSLVAQPSRREFGWCRLTT